MVSGQQLRQRSITTINGLSAVVSNLQVTNPYGPGSPPLITIRGIGSTSLSQSQSNPIAINIDNGIRQLPTFEVMPLFDIDNIEVLRGPQGVLYGKNAEGGVVNITTNRPGFDTSGYVQAGVGNFGRFESEGAVQTPLITDKVALRLAYTIIKDTGTIQNIYPGTINLEQTDSYGIRGSLLVKPSQDFELLARYTHYRSGGRNFGLYADQFNLTQLPYAPTPGAQRQGLGFFQNGQNYVGYRDIVDDGLNIQTSLVLSNQWKLATVTTYDSGKWLSTDDGDGLSVDAARDSNSSFARQFVQDTRLIGDFGHLRILIGAFYSDDHTEIAQQYSFFDNNYLSPTGIANGSIFDTIETNGFTQNRQSYSAFGNIRLALNDRFTIAGGLRLSRDKIKVSNYVGYAGTLSTPLLLQTIALGEVASAFNNISGNVLLDYKLTSAVNIYASWNQGYRIGAINDQAYNDPITTGVIHPNLSDPEEIRAVKPETVNSWEVGAKAQPFGSLLTLNAAAFYSIYRNQHAFNYEIVNSSIFFYLSSVDRARIYGAEIDVSLKPSHRLIILTSLAYTNPVYKAGGGFSTVADNQLIYAAKWSGNASLDWQVIANGSGSLDLHFDTAVQSKTFYNLTNVPLTYDSMGRLVPNYNANDKGHIIFNAALSYVKGRTTVTGYVSNISETHYFTSGGSGFGDYLKVRGNPRQFGLRVRHNL